MFQKPIKKQVGQDNLTYAERQAMYSLQRNTFICIMQADKGGATVIMDKQDYASKVEALVLGDSYELLPSNPTKNVENKINEVIQQLKKRDASYTTTNALRVQNTRWPSLYGAPKIHKKDAPLRPIITTYGTAAAGCAGFVARILKTILDGQNYQKVVKNTEQIVEYLHNHQIPAKFTLVSFDVTNLFGSIDPAECKAVILNHIRVYPNFETKFEIPKNIFVKLLDICLLSNYFEYNHSFYRQVQGIPMGSPASPAFAEFYLRGVEAKIQALPNYNRVDTWLRYMDDVLSLWTGTDRQLDVFLANINSVDTNIKFTVEKENNGQIPFLDIMISKDSNQRVAISMYSKPSDAGLLLNFNSFHPPSTRLNLIKGEAGRYTKLSDNPETDLNKLKIKLTRNDYPNQWIKKHLTQAQQPKKSEPTKQQGRNYLSLPYMGTISHRVKRQAKKHNIQLVSKKNKSLGAMFSASFKHNTRRDANVVYQIDCTCGESYIGETGQEAKKRIKQHKYAVRKGHVNNGLAVHVRESGHSIDWDSFQILHFEPNYKKRKIKEAIFIQQRNPSMNLNSGYRLKGNWTDFV